MFKKDFSPEELMRVRNDRPDSLSFRTHVRNLSEIIEVIGEGAV